MNCGEWAHIPHERGGAPWRVVSCEDGVAKVMVVKE